MNLGRLSIPLRISPSTIMRYRMRLEHPYLSHATYTLSAAGRARRPELELSPTGVNDTMPVLVHIQRHVLYLAIWTCCTTFSRESGGTDGEETRSQCLPCHSFVDRLVSEAFFGGPLLSLRLIKVIPGEACHASRCHSKLHPALRGLSSGRNLGAL